MSSSYNLKDINSDIGYNNNIGYDISHDQFTTGNNNYGTYDVVRRPITTSNIFADNDIISEDNSELPTLGSDGNYYMSSFLYDNAKGVNNMTESINNGRVRDINVISNTQELTKPDNTMVKDNQETSVKGILEESELSNIFFSDTNTDAIQMSIRYGVHSKTHKVISNQSTKELYIIMRSIMLQYANFSNNIDIISEIKKLNAKVLDYCINNVSSNILQHVKYLQDINNMPAPFDHPVYENKNDYTYDISNIL